MRCFSMLSAVSAALSRTVMGSRLFSLSLSLSLSEQEVGAGRQRAGSLPLAVRYSPGARPVCVNTLFLLKPPSDVQEHKHTRARTQYTVI